VGAWRGLHPHKNSAAVISALSALFFFHRASTLGGVFRWALFLAAVVFTGGTQSKTSIGMLAFALVAMMLYVRSQARPHKLKGFRKLIFWTLVLLALTLAIAQEQVLQILSDKSAFTGRNLIWYMLLTYASDHPILGSGFGAFWNSGDASPVLSLTMDEVMFRYKQSHNGYLQILVEIGGIGFLLAMVTIVVLPLRQLLYAKQATSVRRDLYFSWIIFCLGLNFTEAQFLAGSAPAWTFMLIAFAILQQQPSRPFQRRWERR
jgi:exopolysaccharide production protein ExoQ